MKGLPPKRPDLKKPRPILRPIQKQPPVKKKPPVALGTLEDRARTMAALGGY